jgi:hypothetical protein
MEITPLPNFGDGAGDLAADSAGNVYVVNISSAAGETHTYFRYRLTDGEWSTPAVLADHSGGQPRLAIDPNNHLHLAYETESSANHYRLSARPTEARSAISQAVTLPAGSHRPTLSFLYQLRGAGSQNADPFTALVSEGVTGTVVFSTTVHRDTWTHAWVDLTPWAGQTVTLTLAARTTGLLGYTHLDLDEVSLGSWLTPVPRATLPNPVVAHVSTPITITGENFLAGAEVRLGSVPLPDARWISSTTLTATVPSTMPLGLHDLWVTNPGGQVGVLPGGVLVGQRICLPLVLRQYW